MSGYLFQRIATVTVVPGGCLSASVAFAATPAALSTGSAGESSWGHATGNSRQSSAVLEATNIAPGESRKLSDRLEPRFEEVNYQPSPTTLYSGAVDSMPRQTLGRYMPGDSRTDRFSVTFIDRRAALGADLAHNAYMEASLNLRFHWRSSQ